MTTPRSPRTLSLVALVAIAGVLAGAPPIRSEQARAADEMREYDVAVAQYQKAVQQNPNDKEARLGLDRARLRASDAHLFSGRRLASQGRYEDAQLELQVAVELNPTNGQAESDLRAVRTALRLKLSAPADGKTRLETHARRHARHGARRASTCPTVKLPAEIVTGSAMTSRLLFLTLGKLGNISVTFDSQFRDAPAQVSLLSGMTLKQALDAVSKSTNTFYQVSSPATIIVAPDTPAKRREYIEEVFGTIFVRNADSRKRWTRCGSSPTCAASRRSPTSTRSRCATRPERFLAARRFVAAFDKARPEIVVDVEVLEVDRGEDPRVRPAARVARIDRHQRQLRRQPRRPDPAGPAQPQRGQRPDVQHPGAVLPADQDRRAHADAGQPAHPHHRRRRGHRQLRPGRAGADARRSRRSRRAASTSSRRRSSTTATSASTSASRRAPTPNDDVTLAAQHRAEHAGRRDRVRRAADVRQPQRARPRSG